jgi:hypothetical protein
MDAECVLVDVSDLAPPEPLAVAMEAAAQLTPGQYLQIHHWREPLLLYERLARKSFGYDTRLGRDDFCEVFVWRLDDPSATRSAHTAASLLPPWQE